MGKDINSFVFSSFINLSLEEMNMLQFLDRIRYISFEDTQKENQILSQKENSKRSSQVNASQKHPFTEKNQERKSKKKLTWKLKEQIKVEQSCEMEDSLRIHPHSEPRTSLKKASSMMASPLAQSAFQFRKRVSNPQVVFPVDYKQKMKFLMGLR